MQNNTKKFLAFVGILALCWWLGTVFKLEVESLKIFLNQFPITLTGVVFIVAYVVLSLFIWVSKDVLMIAGGYIFGVTVSSIFVLIAEIINAYILCKLARKLGQGFVEAKTQGRFQGLHKRLENVSFVDLFTLRAIIFIPYRFQDLGFGLTKISLKKYMTAVITGSYPRVLLRQYAIVTLGHLVTQDFSEFVAYVQAHEYIFVFSLMYMIAWVFLFFRLKKITFG